MSENKKSQKNKILFFGALIVLMTIASTLVYMQSSNNNVNPISNKMTKDITQNNNNEDKSDKLSLDKIKKIEDIKISLEKPSFWDMLKLWLGFSSKVDELSEDIEKKINNTDFSNYTNALNNKSEYNKPKSNKPFDRTDNGFTHFFEKNKFIIILPIAILLLYILWSIISHEKRRGLKTIKQTLFNKKSSRRHNIHDDEEGLL